MINHNMSIQNDYRLPWHSLLYYDLPFIFPYIQYPAPIIIAKIIKPTITGANTLIRNTTIATITISAITPIIMAPILPNVPIFIQRYSGDKYIRISLGV